MSLNAVVSSPTIVLKSPPSTLVWIPLHAQVTIGTLDFGCRLIVPVFTPTATLSGAFVVALIVVPGGITTEGGGAAGFTTGCAALFFFVVGCVEVVLCTP